MALTGAWLANEVCVREGGVVERFVGIAVLPDQRRNADAGAPQANDHSIVWHRGRSSAGSYEGLFPIGAVAFYPGGEDGLFSSPPVTPAARRARSGESSVAPSCCPHQIATLPAGRTNRPSVTVAHADDARNGTLRFAPLLVE